MAKRESQAVHVALIAFVILTAISWVITIALLVRLNRYSSQAETDAQKVSDLESRERSAVQESNRLKAMVGFPTEANLDTIETSFTADKNAYAAGLEEPQHNYRDIQKYLFTSLQDKQNQILRFQDSQQKLQGQLSQAETSFREQLAVAQNARQEAEQKLQSYLTDLGGQRQQDDAQRQELLRQVAQKTNEAEQVRRESAEQVRNAEEELAVVKTMYDRLKKIVDEMGEPKLEAPDGKITWVDQRSRTVWVNLGRNDGLRRNLSFDVYGRDENNLSTAVKKGRIEITNVRNGHTAEGRIVDDKNTDPILSDDLIASPIWNPGSTLRYALAGKMDINNDGRDDRELVKNLIRQYGGEVDAEDSPDGEVKGDVSVHTRYLVLGERPTEASDPNAIRSYSQMVESAGRYNVEEISVHKLIDAMGLGGRIRDAARTGRYGTPDDSAASQLPRRSSTRPTSR